MSETIFCPNCGGKSELFDIGVNQCQSCNCYFSTSTEAPIKEATASDNVNKPSHYTTGNIEVIDFIEDKQLNFHRGNAVKYIVRAGIKDKSKEIEDIQKAIWYLNREIKRIEAEKERLDRTM